MTTTFIRPNRLGMLAIAFLAAAAVLATTAVTSVRAGVPPPACAILISSVSSPVPAETAVIIVDEPVQVTGTGFTPNATLDITVVFNGVPQATFPQATDGSGNFLLTGSLTQAQIGAWTLTAADGQLCNDTVSFTVVAAAVATPTPEALPNAAMIPAPASTGGGAGLAFAVLGSALIGLALVTLRTRKVTER
ncbi:MAG TPA: hypothetical protein VGO32_06485 [Candidatus Limnocylindria bacterium]|nr:hypothetical protein [Candidatus Limnocylindria bacterium]